MAEYLVPESLDLTLFVGDDFRRRCLNIINHLALRRNKSDPIFGYLNISSADLKRLTQGSYRYQIKFLLHQKIIERNESYCSNELSPRGTFSKSYRFGGRYRGESFKVINVEGESPQPRFDDTTYKHDPICVVLAQNCCRLTLDHSALTALPFEVKSEAVDLATQLRLGSANVRRGRNVNRIYHRVNQASKEVRKLLLLEGKPIVECDAKSAHPVLALSLYTDQNDPEAQAYRQLLKQGVYSVYGLEIEGAKKQLRKFFYSKKHCLRKDGSSTNPVAKYFRYHFPVLFSAIVGSTNLAEHLQNLESYFFNDFIVPKAQELDLFYLSIHDGFLCASVEAAETLKYLIQKEFNRKFQYTPEITTKDTPVMALPTVASSLVPAASSVGT